jgi:signal peptidase I
MNGHRAGQPSHGRRTLERLAQGRPLWLTRVQGRSMEPTLRDGQLVPTRRLRRTDQIRRGDVVLAQSADSGGRVVKRVIGLPSEHITIVDGHLSVDGRPLHEPYARRSVFNGQFSPPEGTYLLLGDNRDMSTDSRVWGTPYVPRHQLTARLHPDWGRAIGVGRPGGLRDFDEPTVRSS